MNKTFAIAQLYPVIEEKLHAGGCITITTTGYSMLPMLNHHRDTVVLGPITDMPHINDVVLYQRDNGSYVMHRIVGREKNGDYILCGDNQIYWEHHIKRQQILGILVAFTRKDRQVSCSSLCYKVYVYLLPVIRLLRHLLTWCRMQKGALNRLIHR